MDLGVVEKGAHEGRSYGEGVGRVGAVDLGVVEKGDHECRPYGGRWKGRARGTPLRGKVERGCPRGTPLRGKVERAPTRPYEGRPYGGWGRFVSGRADVGREREGWVPACARTTEGEGMTGEGWVTSPSPRGQALRGNNGRGRGFHCGMTGYTGTGGSRTARTGEGAGAWGQSIFIFIAITGEGAHEGRPYGGRVERGCPRGTPLRGLGKIRKWEGQMWAGRGRDGSPHARTTEGEGMTGEGWVTSPSPRGQALRGNNGRGRGFHCGMTGYTGTGGSRTARTGEGRGCMGAIYFHSNHGRGRPRGAPLRGKVERACTRDAPMGEGGKGAARGTPLWGKVWGVGGM